MTKMSKLICFVLAILTMLTLCVACGNGDKTTETKTETETSPPVIDATETNAGRDSVQDSVPSNLSFKGETVTFFVREDIDLWKKEMDVDEITNDTLYDSIYRRNVTVEERLGVEIKQISQLGQHNYQEAWNGTLRNAVFTKSGDFDAAAFYSAFGVSLALEGCFYNVLDLTYLDLEQPWWNQTVIDEVSLFDSLYFLAGDITVTQSADAVGMFFNKRIFDEFHGVRNINLYDVVKDGQWTIDYMYDLVARVWRDNNSDGAVDPKDVIGFAMSNHMDQWIPALGIELTQKLDGLPVITIYDEHTVAAWEKLQRLYVENPFTFSDRSLTETAFAEGTQLFVCSQLNAGSKLRDMEDQYGVLPIPKFDETQGNYRTRVTTDASLIAVLSDCINPDLISATLELMAAESYKQVTPAYYDICLKSKYASAPEDAAMYDIILDGIYFDFGICYSVPIGNLANIFRDITVDLAQFYEGKKEIWNTNLDDLIDKLDEVSFLTK